MSDKSFLQWPFLSDDHRQLAVALEEWAGEHIAPLAEAGHGHNDAELDSACRELVACMAAGGWLEHAVSQGAGGKPDVRTLCLIRETLARHWGLADFCFAMQGLGSGPISLFADEELKRRYLPDVVAGRKLAAFALSEADAGSDVAAMTTSAVRVGDEFVINGAKTWISNGGLADFYCLFVRTGEAPGARGLSCLVVDADNPGLKITERIPLMAPHPLGTLQFEDCKVPANHLIGKAGAGFRVAMATLDVFRSTVGAAALGFARRALDEAVDYSGRREMFGGRLGDLQMTRGRLADMAVQIDAAALLIYRAAWVRDEVADRVTREAAMAKLYATEAAWQIIDSAVQLHGGQGVKTGSIVEELYREVRALRIYEGASEVQKVIIASQLLSGGERQ